MWKTVRTIANSVGGTLLLLLAAAILKANPLLGILLFLAALDQFEDVHYMITGRRLIPPYLAPLDVAFELIMLGFALAVFITGALYFAYFRSLFFLVIFLLSPLVAWSAIDDLAWWAGVFSRGHRKVLGSRRFWRR